MKDYRKKSSNTAIIVTVICSAAVVIIGAILAFTVIAPFFTFVFDQAYREAGTTFRESLEIVVPRPSPSAPPVQVPAIPTDPIDAQELEGLWAYEHGNRVYFFGLSDFIMFTYFGDSRGEVFESQWEEWGDWYVGEDGRLFVEAEWTGSHVFSLILYENTLTIIDIDGDSITYTRVE